jgi:tetratricopeptide (TPR) repeat protein
VVASPPRKSRLVPEAHQTPAPPPTPPPARSGSLGSAGSSGTLGGAGSPGQAGPPSAILQTMPAHGPEGAEALHRRLDNLVEAGRWAEAVDVLKALGAAGEPVMRAKYLTTAAKIVHHKLGGEDEAVELFNRALDAHPDDLAVFERLYQILAGRRAWRAVESNLLRMIARIKADDALEKAPTLEALWRRLGDIYRVGLEDPVSATNAYQMCARLAPQDPRYPTMITQLSAQLSTQLSAQLSTQLSASAQLSTPGSAQAAERPAPKTPTTPPRRS